MEEAKLYLDILSKVMRERQYINTPQKENYGKLYKLFHEELNLQIKDAQYPNAPTLMKKADDLLDSMESFFICPEIIGKCCLRIYAYNTNALFSSLKTIFIDQNFANQISACHTQIPFIVSAGDSHSIEVLNYANGRAILSVKELKMLLTGSGKNKVALNKIIKAFIIKTPMENDDICFLFDNVYANLKKMFDRCIEQSVLYISRSDEFKHWKNKLAAKDVICCSKDIVDKIKDYPGFRNVAFVPTCEIVKFAKQQTMPVLYGYMDEFYALRAQVNAYYQNCIAQSQQIIRNISSDIIRMDTNSDSMLSQMRQNERNKEEELKTEKKQIDAIMLRIEEYMDKAVSDLDDRMTLGKTVPRHVWDHIFERLFIEAPDDLNTRKTILSHLTLLGYDDCHLVSSYFRALDGELGTYSCLIHKGEWEKAKMLIEISDLSRLSPECASNYVKIAGPIHLTTGKELFARAHTMPYSEQIPLLYLSFDKGYVPAGEELLQRYKQSENVNLQTLVNSLMPEACMIAGNREKKLPRFYQLSSPKFTYYKIAASRQYYPAIEKIADEIYYEFNFSHAKPTFKDKKMKEISPVICELCRYLIGKNYKVDHFREIYGVVLFCMGQDYSAAMAELGGIDTGIAHYCKGKMLEYGDGVVKDLKSALEHYKKAKAKDFRIEYMDKCIIRCNEKIKKHDERQTSKTNYQEGKNYTQNRTQVSTSSSSGCFITTAACQAMHAEDDCNELNLLRHFRDEHIRNTDAGAAIVREYYRVGPLIVHAIEQLPDPFALYQELWEQYIYPSYSEIQAEHWQAAQNIYVQMVAELCCRFHIMVDPQICDILKSMNI